MPAAGGWAELRAGEQLPRAAAAAARSPDEDAAAPVSYRAQRPGLDPVPERTGLCLEPKAPWGGDFGICSSFLSPPHRKRKVKCKGTTDFVSGGEAIPGLRTRLWKDTSWGTRGGGSLRTARVCFVVR